MQHIIGVSLLLLRPLVELQLHSQQSAQIPASNMRSHDQAVKNVVVVNVDQEESKTEGMDEREITITSSIDQKLNKLYANSPYSQTACIYKVSQKLRKRNEAAFTPRLVSIGPIHHDLVQLQGMQACKLRFLHNFLMRFGIGLDSLVKIVAKEESFVRGCYEGDTIKLSSEQFIEKVLLDGIFIVELFLEDHFFQLRDRNEIIFENRLMYNDLLHDMLLLENQLPLSIMKNLLNFVDFSLFLNGGIKLTIYDLAHRFFKNVGTTQKVPLTEKCNRARHFVEFLLFLHAPEEMRLRQQHGPTSSASRIVEYTRSATELHKAGVQFNKGEGKSLFEVVFDKDKGELTIPKLTVNEMTETFFKNLVAFEQSGYFGGYYSKNITSYVILMDSFIDTRDDVDLLVNNKIIENELGDGAQVAHLFNNLHKEVMTEPKDFYFAGVCQDLNEYSRDWIHQLKARWFNWIVMLKREYFSNPWSIISLMAAIVLLILTIMQTVCSFLQVQ